MRAGGKYLVYETGCQGLVVAGALERVGGSGGGKVIHVYQTGNPQTQSLGAMNFTSDVLANLLTLNLFHLRSLEAGEDITLMHQQRPPQAESEAQGEGTGASQRVPHRQRLREESVQSYELMKGGMDGLIVACKQHPTAILLSLMRFVTPASDSLHCWFFRGLRVGTC